VAVLDELHKFRRWKSLLKGFYDLHSEEIRLIVTGSSRLDVYRRGGDSLMGRYFLYRMHPFSIAELATPTVSDAPVRPPAPIGDDEFFALLNHGGFPDPFLHRSDRFSRRWRRLRRHQLLQEDIRDLTGITELSQLELLEGILSARSGEQLVYANLARNVSISQDTARRWVSTLCALHHGFLVRPWFRNVTRALRKEPKWFLRDWSGIADPGKRAETFVACHLLKAVEGWTDLGLGDFELRYLRDRQKREVDFLVVRDDEPWFLVEVKNADDRLSRHLAHFQAETGAMHAFHAVLEDGFRDLNCFEQHSPVVVPVRTLLSQLL